jgi:hypothetical protein
MNPNAAENRNLADLKSPAPLDDRAASGDILQSQQPRNILFACCEQRINLRAFDVALQFARDRTTTLRCSCIIERLPVAADLVMEGAFRSDQAVCAEKLAELRSAAAEANIPIDVETLFGVSHEQIVNQIHAHDIDLLILPVKHLGILAQLKRWYIAKRAGRGCRRLILLAVDEKGMTSFVA